jgi:hypothetical protein
VQAFDDLGAVATDYSAGVEYLQNLGAKLQMERGNFTLDTTARLGPGNFERGWKYMA